MTPPSSAPFGGRLLGRLLLVLFLALGGWRLATLDYAAKFGTNVLELIPADEQDHDAHLLRGLATQRQSRVVLATLAYADDATRTPDPLAVAAMLKTLRDSGAFSAVELLDDEPHRELGTFLFEQRFNYLFPAWLARERQRFDAAGRPESEWPDWLAEETVVALDAFLQRPDSSAYEDVITRDPLLLVPTLLDRVALAPDTSSSPGPARIWMLANQPPLEESGQQPVADAVQNAFAAARAIAPELALQWTGVGRFAAASRARMEGELKQLNLASVLAVFVVTLLLVRAPWRVLHLLPVVAISLLGAWLAVTTVFVRVHVLVLVVGALLAGTAVDYGFHLFTRAGTATPFKGVIRSLAASCITTLVGFSLLIVSELPLLRHVGVFVVGGLLAAFAAAVVYFGNVRRPLEVRAWPALRQGVTARRRVRIAVVAGLVVMALGLPRVHWRDDIRLMQAPLPELSRNDDAVRHAFGETGGSRLFLTHGDDIASARRGLAEFESWLAVHAPERPLLSIGLILPSAETLATLPEAWRQLGDFPEKLGLALERHGYLSDSFAGFARDWQAARLDALATPPDLTALTARLQQHLSGPLSLLIDVGSEGAWMLSTVGETTEKLAVPQWDHTSALNQVQTLNHLFSRYRRDALLLSLAGLGLLGGGVFWLYGRRGGLLIFGLPVFATLVTFAGMALAGLSLNLFHLLGAFLGVCLSHDYAIFLHQSLRENAPPPASIRLSALSTAASFLVLATSAIPIVAALGLTVATIVLVAYAAVELLGATRGESSLSTDV